MNGMGTVDEYHSPSLRDDIPFLQEFRLPTIEFKPYLTFEDDPYIKRLCSTPHHNQY